MQMDRVGRMAGRGGVPVPPEEAARRGEPRVSGRGA